MLNRLHYRMQTISSLKILVVLLVIFSVLIGIFMFSPFSPVDTLNEYSGGVGVLDSEFYYTSDRAYEILTAFGEKGRQFYVSVIFPIDLFIPILQALFFSVAITVVFQRAFSIDNPIQKLNLLPFAAVVADYLENIAIFSLIVAYPTRLNAVAALAGYFTAVKFILIIGSFIFLVMGILRLVWNKIRPNRPETNSNTFVN